MRPARRIASSIESRGPGLPGIVGTPDSLTVDFATDLSPIRRIASGDGPIHFRPTSSRISAKCAFSARKPYPGWTASASVISAAATSDVMFRYEPEGAAGPMHTDSSAARTWSASRSASEWTATVATPSSLQAAMMRSAISPRLATSTFWNNVASVRLDREQLLAELDGLRVLRVDRHDRARRVGLGLVHGLHRLADAERPALLDDVADLHEGLGVGIRRAVERAHDRGRQDVEALALPGARRPRRHVRGAARRGRRREGGRGGERGRLGEDGRLVGARQG